MFVLFQVLQQECVEAELLDEVDSSGKTLLDRLTTPVIFPDGYTHTHNTHTHTHSPYFIHTPYSSYHRFRSEQYFGSPSDTATAAEGVRERLLLVEEQRLQLQEAGLHNDDDEVLNGQEARLDVIGEELSEKEDQEEEDEVEEEVEEEEAGPQDEELDRATQAC